MFDLFELIFRWQIINPLPQNFEILKNSDGVIINITFNVTLPKFEIEICKEMGIAHLQKLKFSDLYSNGNQSKKEDDYTTESRVHSAPKSFGRATVRSIYNFQSICK